MAEDFFRKLASPFTDSGKSHAQQQPPASQQHRPSPFAASSYQREPPPSYGGARMPHSAGVQDRERFGELHRSTGSRAHPPPSHSPLQPPHTSHASYASPQSRSPAPHGSADRAPQRSPQPVAHPTGAPASAAVAAPAAGSEWDHLSLEALRAEHATHQHTLDVLDMRLKHCLESEDSSSASVAAAAVAQEKRVFRELSAHLAMREKRDRAEQRVRDAIGARFSGERITILEHRKQVDRLKQRLRTAFAVPFAVPVSSPSPLPSSSPEPGSAASASASASASDSLFDLLPRMRLDVGKAQVALEHQNLRVDSIELSTCVEAAQLDTPPPAQIPVGGPGGPSDSFSASLSSSSAASSASFSPASGTIVWSDSLHVFFKSSRREVVTRIQAVLAECDGLTAHIRRAEEFCTYLQEDAVKQQQQQQGAGADSAMS